MTDMQIQGVKMKMIIRQGHTSAEPTVKCKNAYASTEYRRWLSFGGNKKAKGI